MVRGRRNLVRIGLAQMQICWDEPGRNIRQAETMLEEAADEGGSWQRCRSTSGCRRGWVLSRSPDR